MTDLSEGLDGLRKMQLAQLADSLDACRRFGEDRDVPEGSRFIHMSDTLAREISSTLRRAAK